MELCNPISTMRAPANVRVIPLDGPAVATCVVPNPGAVAAGLCAIAAAKTAEEALGGACRLALTLPSVAGAAILRRDARGHPDLASNPDVAPVPPARLARAIAAMPPPGVTVSDPVAPSFVELPPDLLLVPFARDGAVIGALILCGDARMPAAAAAERLAAAAIAVTTYQTLEVIVARAWMQRSVPRADHEQALNVARRLIRGALCPTETGYLLENASPADVARAAALASEGAAVGGLALTRRDVTYLWLLAAGCGNRQIARELGLAESTTKNNLSILFDKIGARDRTQAVLYAIAKGIVPRPVASIRDDPPASASADGTAGGAPRRIGATV